MRTKKIYDDLFYDRLRVNREHRMRKMLVVSCQCGHKMPAIIQNEAELLLEAHCHGFWKMIFYLLRGKWIEFRVRITYPFWKKKYAEQLEEMEKEDAD